jgi:hypothetical protein
MTIKKTILAGITQENELYFLEVEPKHEGHNYFAMSSFTVKPTPKEDAERLNREMLEDGELWKQEVEAGNTELGLSEWVDYVIDSDGDLCMIDNSLFDEEVEVDGDTYIFESGSCGQHEEHDLKHCFIPEQTFNDLMSIWKEHHLKEVEVILPELPEQDMTAEAIRAIELINAES